MLRRLYHDQDLRKRLGQNAAETVQKYTWERNGRELSMIFGDIVRRRAPEHTPNSDAGIMRSADTNNPRSTCLFRFAFLCR